MNKFFNGGLDARAYLRASRLLSYLSFAFMVFCLTAVLSVKLRWEVVMPVIRLLRDPLVVQIAYILAFAFAFIVVVVLASALHFLYVKDLVYQTLSLPGSESSSSNGLAAWQFRVCELERKHGGAVFQVVSQSNRAAEYYVFLQGYLNDLRGKHQGRVSGADLSKIGKYLVEFDRLPSVKEGRKAGKISN